MAIFARQRDLIAIIGGKTRKSFPAQSVQAGLVAEHPGPSVRACEAEPMQRGATAAFKIGFIPHGGNVGNPAVSRNSSCQVI
ncbi:hypothetical protein GOB84_07225 [Acetobacter sp. LMG 1637]|uniref:Uncharacterized protein n=1 Tax=Acetobacter fallax TaxID=1737473 RepID=A0ABX0KCY5_9PROT|nr:hypothetical protein [Acetobacter fallax]